MNRKRTALAIAGLVAAGAAVTALTIPASADPGTGTVAPIAPEVQAAVERDLGLTPGAAQERFRAEERAARVEPGLRRQLGETFGGGWLSADGKTYKVGVTDKNQARKVKAAGAEPVTVARSERQLDAIRTRLDGVLSGVEGIPVWYTDVTTNSVVVKAHAGVMTKAADLVRGSGVDGAAVRVVESTEAPRPLIDVIGGNAYYIGSGTRCSIGFSVNGGFVTAGHCGSNGASTTQPSGTFRGSSFPGNDYAWVQVAAGNTPRGLVNNYSGGTVTVAGSTEAAVGSSICRSGSTTGWRCGTIQARNSSVTYPQGTVTGLIQTTVCAEPGDSGGSAISGSQAQGVTSGGSGNCSSGGTTYFQPVNEILSVYGLTLVTGGGNPTPTPTGTSTPPGGCTGYSGTLSAGGSQVQPNNSYYQSTVSGTHGGRLCGPAGADFDLFLQKWNGSSWAQVAKSDSPSNNETISYSGTAGYYRYVVQAYAGSGAYTLGITKP